MSELGISSAIGALSTTGLEAYEVSQGVPVSISQTTVAGVPVTSTTVGNILTGTSGTLIAVVALILAAIVLYFYLKKG